METFVIKAGAVTVIAEFLDTPTAEAIEAALPITTTAQTWGNEIYFSASVNVKLEEDAKDVIEAGEIAFWVEGSCIAIGFGKTPISRDDEIRLAARTNIWAKARRPMLGNWQQSCQAIQ